MTTQNEQQEFPHFYAWLQHQQKGKRPGSAVRSPHSTRPISGSTVANRVQSAVRQSHSSSIKASNASSRPGSPVLGALRVGQISGQHGQHAQMGRHPTAAGAAVKHGSVAASNNNNSSSMASSPAAAKHKRPMSAAPQLMVTAQQVTGHIQAARPCSAVPQTQGQRQQQLQQRQHESVLQPVVESWHQQQQQQQQQQQPRLQRPWSAVPGASTAVYVQGQRPMSAAAWPIKQETNAQHAAAGQQQQQQQQHAQPSWQKQRAHKFPSSSSGICPAWLMPQVTPTVTSPATPAYTCSVSARISSSSGSSSGPTPKCSDSSPTILSRPPSPLGHALARSSRPSSPISCIRPGSSSTIGTASGVGLVRPSSPSQRFEGLSQGLSPWAGFGSDAPLTWQRVSSPDALQYIQQQQEEVQQQQQQQQDCIAAEQQASQAIETNQAYGQTDNQLSQHQQGPQGPDRLTDTQWQQQQQQQQQQACCRHQSALQLFKQLPLSGAAAATSVTREVLQQMQLGLHLELQRVQAPMALALPDSTDAEWSAAAQVGPELQLWQQLTAELVRQAHLDCSERGQLLQATTDRQQQLLQQALDMCDTLQQTLLSTAAAQQQQQQGMLAAQAEAQTLQQDNTRLKALLETKQAKLVSTAVELEEQRERMRRGRFHLIHEQVQEARMEVEKRALRELEAKVHKARTAAEEAAAARQEVLLGAVEELAGREVLAAVLQQLQAYDVDNVGTVQPQQQEQQQQGEEDVSEQADENADGEGA